ncbi:MAG: hypothetical protein ACRDUS_03325 [Mycobacterium sp.]
MSKHSEDGTRQALVSKNPYSDWRLVIAVPMCTLFLAIALTMYLHPTTCNHKPMGQWDHCHHHWRTKEQLLTGSPEHVPSFGYDRHGQIVYNRIFAGAAAIMGTAGWARVIVWARREYIIRKARGRPDDRLAG